VLRAWARTRRRNDRVPAHLLRDCSERNEGMTGLRQDDRVITRDDK
jgi:hypothetical protein